MTRYVDGVHRDIVSALIPHRKRDTTWEMAKQLTGVHVQQLRIFIKFISKVIYSPTNAQVNCLKNNIKIYIKILRHVSA